MSGRVTRPGSYWDHREARRVVWPVVPGQGGSSAAARAASDRAVASQGAETFWEPLHAAMVVDADGPLPRPSAVLVGLTAALAPGTALDLGSGQGGTAFWLARHGWAVTTVDVSPTALARVAERAAAAGLSQGVRVEKHDLSATFPEGVFDLVTAQYLHSPVEMDRAAVLRRAAAAVAPGGMLLVVDHASVHPWSWADPATVFPTPRQTVDSLQLDPDAWQAVTAEDRDREADGPGGQRATVTDTVIALVRRDADR